VSPVHALGQFLFSVHMTQHELLMVVAAPLLVLGRPGRIWLLALPPSFARRAMQRVRLIGGERVWDALVNPFVATLVHALALWLWHVPILFVAAHTSEWAHALQHASFLLTALLFWHAVLFGARREAGFGLGVLYLFFTAMHSGALGALITFAAAPWYPGNAQVADAWGLSLLEDQQIGGLIMWVPGGLVYVVAALLLFARWLRDSERRTNRRSSLVHA
jgi:putative membrane protein